MLNDRHHKASILLPQSNDSSMRLCKQQAIMRLIAGILAHLPHSPVQPISRRLQALLDVESELIALWETLDEFAGEYL